MSKNLAYLQRFKKQKKFLKLKSKDIVYYSLKTLNKLEKTKEKKKQIKIECTVIKAIAIQIQTLVAKTNPFVKIKIPLLLPKVQVNQDFASKTL